MRSVTRSRSWPLHNNALRTLRGSLWPRQRDAYGTAKRAYDAAKAAYDGDPTVATAEMLRDAAVEAQMKANAASALAVTGTAEQMAMAADAVTDADAAVAYAVQTLVARQIDAQIDAGIDAANAIGKYNLAKAKYDTAATAYGANDADVGAAETLVANAAAALTAALAAQMYANAGGTDEQISTATDAVAVATKALADARYEEMQARTAAAAKNFEMEIRTPTRDAVAMLDATAERTVNDVVVTVVPMDIAKGAATSIGNGWYRADVETAADDDDVTVTVFTNIQNAMAKFAATHNGDIAGIALTIDTGVLRLTIRATNDGDAERAAIGGLIVSAKFPTSSSGALTYTYGVSSRLLTTLIALELYGADTVRT